MKLSQMDKMVVSDLFLSEEKQSLYQVMCAVRLIGKHHIDEKNSHIYEVMSVTGISTDDQAKSRLLKQSQMINILRRMDEIKKLYFAKFVSITGLIGGITEDETKLINWLFSEINVPTDF